MPVVDDVKLLNDVITMVVKFVTIGGGFWLVWGVVVLAGALKDKNGPGLQSGVWQIVGGGLIMAAATLFKNIVAAATAAAAAAPPTTGQ